MAQITRQMCEDIIRCFHEKRHYGLTQWEAAQLAYAWLEREDGRATEYPLFDRAQFVEDQSHKMPQVAAKTTP